jgi:integrase
VEQYFGKPTVKLSCRPTKERGRHICSDFQFLLGGNQTVLPVDGSGRTSESPVWHLKGLNVRTDRRHDRRALEPDEIRRLLKATAAGPIRYGMSGQERYLIYYLPATTGLRANDIRGLEIKGFDLNAMTVVVRAGHAKNRREDTLPLRPELTAMLKEFFRGRLPNVRAFGGTWKQLTKRTSDMIREDLEAAHIPYVDDSGRYADFHSLRHSTGSLLAASGVHPKVAQVIMRHFKIDLTLSRYTHILRGRTSEAVAKLPDLSLPISQGQVATGTDDKMINAGRDGSADLTPLLTSKTYVGCKRSASAGTSKRNTSDFASGLDNSARRDLGDKNDDSSPVDTGNGEGGIRTRGAGLYPHDGLANRCLQPLGHLSIIFLTQAWHFHESLYR